MSTTTHVGEFGIPREEILDHLQLLLADRRFASAERNAKFLRYVVDCALQGKTEQIKETVIAVEVYGRPGNYDPKSDSIVRVEATRLRQKLRSYYDNEGKTSPIRIHVPSGGYTPRFERVASPASLELPAPPVAQTVPTTTIQLKPAKVWKLAWFGIAATALALFFLATPDARREVGTPPRPALDAWQEGVALLWQDPHSGESERGAPATLTRAIDRLEFSVAKDPKFARAWATLAEAYDYATTYVGRDSAEDARRAEAAARRAIALDNNLADGHHMLALIYFRIHWDYKAAEREYRQTLELDPQKVYAAVEYADLLRETGRVQEAEDLIRKCRALLPAMPQLAVKEAEISVDMGRPDAAIAAANAALALKRNYLRAEVVLGQAWERKGDYTAALRHYEHVLAANPSERRALPAYGFLLARTGQRERAEEIARQLETTNANVRKCAVQVATVYAGLREYDRAINWLERAWSSRQAHFPSVRIEDRFRGMRDDARFRSLIAKVPVT